MPGRDVQIDLVLSDDWELRGDGSGNMRALQFGTLERILDVYERNGLRGSFNVEVLQQLAHIDHGREHPELADLAREWEERVTDAVRRGHDVQLHIHPQWTQARYENGSWSLGGSWSVLDYSAEEFADLVRRAKEYLEALLRPLDRDYRCVAFRSGSWCIAPSDSALATLAGEGIVFDISVVDGLYYNTAHVTIDYRALEEPFLPYYPVMSDARRVSSQPEPLIVVPTHSFARHIRALPVEPDERRPAASWRYRAALLPVFLAGRGGPSSWRARFLPPNGFPVPDAGHRSTYASDEWSNVDDQASIAHIRVSDLCTLTLNDMKEMLRNARRRARASGAARVPVIVENHTKDIGNWWPVERFAAHVARQDDMRVITLRELAAGLRAGAYPIRTALAG